MTKEGPTEDEVYPVTRMTRMLADLIGQTMPIVNRSKTELLEAAAEVRKYETLLASARERHELASEDYKMQRGLLMIGWEQLQSDIRNTKPLPPALTLSEDQATVAQ